MYRLSIKYYGYIIKMTGAVIDEPNTFIFKRLKKAIKPRIVAIKGVE